ncbi:lysozyme inhibitor LprI family protein [Chitinimonas koreensis]|uniref:lysozyme inhibitor LprI family protein n=1 Tax=Chitinimonas koreensis TaxID=356302 RepID=UPI0003F713B2|nr:lysozyme inhibitor LprI family protein [Chitinimonas koreensis]QNM97551.1 DUF1311 domain-containing protein [Chitinimonas koreensis]
MRAAACILAAALAAGAAAADDPCPNATSQFDLNQCAGEAYGRADQRLNREYAALRGELDAAGQARLKAAQQAWLKLRDLDCAYQTHRSIGGSIHGMNVAFCRAAASEARASQFERWRRELGEPQ